MQRAAEGAGQSAAAQGAGGPQPKAAVTRQSGARRVIFVNRYFFPDLSATSQILTDLVRALECDGFRLHVICSRQLYDDSKARLRARDRVHGAVVHRVWSARFGRYRLGGRAWDYASFALAATWTLLWLARRGDVVVVMTDPPLMCIGAAAAARARGARLINWLQDVFPEVATALGALRLPGWAAALLLRTRNWSLRTAERNVVLGTRMHRRISALQVPRCKQQIIENWADAEALTPLPTQWSSLRRSLDAPGRFIVQYSGNMGRAHEYETLLGAALELREEDRWLFLFVGGGANMQRLRNKAEQYSLRNMRFLPYQPRDTLRDCLAAADVHMTCLLPALEGLVVPSKLYGILAAGRPVLVIGDPDGEQAKIVRAGGCGSVITSGDSAGLAGELRRMRTDPDWMQQAGQNARQLFEQRYTLRAAADKWRAVLQGIE